jgi:phospholipase C
VVRLLVLVAATLLAACGSGGNGSPAFSKEAAAIVRAGSPSSPISHIVIIVQENRTVDNLFQTLPGANTAKYGLNLQGQQVLLKPVGLTARYDLGHRHSDWLAAYNGGAMNGWSNERCSGHCGVNPAYAFVPPLEVQPYYTMAEAYTFGDEMFESSEGPSFPAHQYLVSGTSTNVDGSRWRVAEDTGENQGGCDSFSNSKAAMINPKGREGDPVFPCFDRTSIFTLLDAAQVSWHFYQVRKTAGPWNAVDALKPIWENQQEYSTHVTVPSSQLLNDIAGGNLANVVYVTPTAAESDHGGDNNGTGPSWVTSIVNAIGSSPYWSDTAILVVWDDWGGWFDHVTPTIYNSYELGMRVPLIVVSPYAKTHYVSHVQYEFGSILRFVEETFNLGSMGTTDARANDLSDCFNYGAKPRPFKLIRAPYSANYFLHEPPSDHGPDDE